MGDFNDAFMRNQNSAAAAAAAAVQARVKPPQNRANVQQLKLVIIIFRFSRFYFVIG